MITPKWGEIKFDGGYGYYLDSNGVPLRRIEELNCKLVAEMLTLKYENKKVISDCESTDTWQSKDWLEAGGAYTAETTLVLEGDQSAKCVGDTTLYGIHNVFASAKDLTAFDNSEVSSTSDYICFAIYITTAEIAKLGTGIKLLIHKDAELTKTNYYYYAIAKGSLANGWNVFKVAKSSFTEQGTASWSAVTGISFEFDGSPSSSCTFYVDAISLLQAQTKGMIVPLNGAANFSMTDAGDYKSIKGDLEITSADYYENVALVGTKMDGKAFICILKDVCHDGNIDLALKEKVSVVNSVEFNGCYKTSTPISPPIEIRDYI